MAKFPESADALDDDFDLDTGLVASEDEEPAQEAEGSAPGPSTSKKRALKAVIEDEEDEFASDDQDEQQDSDDAAEEEQLEEVPEANDSGIEEDEYGLPVNKRVREEVEREAAKNNATPATKEDKKRKRKEKVKEAKRKKTKAMDEAEAEVETSFIAYQPPQLQADFIAEMQALAMPKMSAIEMEDFRIAESFLLDTTLVLDRKSLKGFVKAATKLKEADLKAEASKTPGSPRLLIVSGAALRVADVVREVKDLAAKSEVAKLFAKHFKLAEHATYCQKTKFGIAAGTPDRIMKLVEADALQLDSASHLVVDMKKDAKKRNILDIPESRIALFKLLANEKVNNRMKEGKLKLVLY